MISPQLLENPNFSGFSFLSLNHNTLAHAQIQQPFSVALSSVARVLDATRWHVTLALDEIVDVEHASVQAASELFCFFDVFREEGGSETVFGIVG